MPEKLSLVVTPTRVQLAARRPAKWTAAILCTRVLYQNAVSECSKHQLETSWQDHNTKPARRLAYPYDPAQTYHMPLR